VLTFLKLTNNNKPERLELSESEIPWKVSRIALGMESVTQRKKQEKAAAWADFYIRMACGEARTCMIYLRNCATP